MKTALEIAMENSEGIEAYPPVIPGIYLFTWPNKYGLPKSPEFYDDWPFSMSQLSFTPDD